VTKTWSKGEKSQDGGAGIAESASCFASFHPMNVAGGPTYSQLLRQHAKIAYLQAQPQVNTCTFGEHFPAGTSPSSTVFTSGCMVNDRAHGTPALNQLADSLKIMIENHGRILLPLLR
jgi:hypothetical protein